MELRRHFTGTRWETAVGYCRAVRAGNLIFVSGTAPVSEDGGTYAPYDGYAQARRCFEIVQQALAALEADLADVVRTRMFVTDLDQFEAITRAHREFFGEHPPASTLVEVKGLVNPDMVIEVEVDAVAG
ncbi:MAG: RidA family protein [Leptolyngbya sp. SIO4C1]|nr:RidA family protein [Leptolyngbya sp. SIO4C1]